MPWQADGLTREPSAPSPAQLPWSLKRLALSCRMVRHGCCSRSHSPWLEQNEALLGSAEHAMADRLLWDQPQQQQQQEGEEDAEKEQCHRKKGQE